MEDEPGIYEDLLAAVEAATRSGNATWLQMAGSPGYINCYIGMECIAFLVYVDADEIGSPFEEVDAVEATFRNIKLLYIQPSVTAPGLIELLRLAKEDTDSFRKHQRQSRGAAQNILLAMASGNTS